MKAFYKLTLCVLMVWNSDSTTAQEKTMPITLEKVLQLGGADNLTIKEYKLKQELAMAELYKAKEWWLPEVYAGLAIHQLWGSSMNGDGRFFTDVNRQSFWGGAGIDATWDFAEGMYRAKSAGLLADAGRHVAQAEKNNTIIEMLETYYNFMAAQLNVVAYNDLVLQAEDLASQIKIQVENGMRYESEYLLSKSNSNHWKVELLNAKMSFSEKSARLSNQLNLSADVSLVGTDTILTVIELIPEIEILPKSESALSSRPELLSMNLTLQSLQTEKKTQTSGLLFPKFQLGSYSSYFGDVFSPLFPTSAINASVIWKLPTGRLLYGGDVKKINSRIAIQQNQMEQMKAQVNEEIASSKNQLIISKEQILAAKEGSLLARQALSQCLQRQQLGTVRPFEILQAQEVYIKSRLDYIKAVSTHNKLQYRLFVALGNNL